jgi:cytochrome c
MKRTFFTLSILGLLLSCNESKPKETTETAAEKPTETSLSGESLLKTSDCMTCHQIEGKLVGPAYKDVATKYAGQSDAKTTLIKSIIEGSKGKYGEVPMTAHASLAKEDVEKMVDYILTIK